MCNAGRGGEEGVVQIDVQQYSIAVELGPDQTRAERDQAAAAECSGQTVTASSVCGVGLCPADQ